MAILKCKMCGGGLNIEDGSTVAVCEYCGSKQTVPRADDEKKMKLFDRANRLRFNCEFDKAGEVYENIIEEFPEEAEAYWGNLLCKYGIEYVDDPATGDKIPTCHRSSFDSFMDDPDFEMVMENSDTISRNIYREQAKQIEEIRKQIIEVSGKEAPYDIFICYKETAEDGQRTIDSVIAQDVYDALTDKGYKVFFSRISLEDKLGTEYEPYIFAALNSAKVMLAFGTSYDYYNAVWVKNEWSRFIKLMAKDKTKILIPCYKDIDAYDMPKAFAKLQAQDMGKVGALQDLVRGVDKITGKGQENPKAVQSQTVIQQVISDGSNTEALVKRGFMSLEDGAFDAAKKYFDDALNINAECADAYLGLFMVEIKAKDKESASKQYIDGDFSKNRCWLRAKQFATDKLHDDLTDWEEKRAERLAMEKEKAYEEGEQSRKEQEAFLSQYEKGILEFPDNIRKQCAYFNEKAEKLEKEWIGLTEIISEIEKESAYAKEKIALKETEERINEREKYYSSLGLFSGKEKKEVQAEINSLKQNKEELLESIKENETKEAEIKRKAEETKTDIDYAKNKLEELSKGFIVENAKRLGILKLQLKYFRSGDTLTFGRYEQGNGTEPIEWKILEADGNKALLFSRYALDVRPYNDEDGAVTWETCTLRNWLNNEFYEKAFNSEEQKLIIGADVNADKNPDFTTNPGNPTKDYVFILSLPEAEKYIFGTKDCECIPTKHTIKQGVRIGEWGDGKITCYWWLRSPGMSENFASRFDDIACVDSCNSRVNLKETGVRPAIWVNIDDSDFVVNNELTQTPQPDLNSEDNKKDSNEDRGGSDYVYEYIMQNYYERNEKVKAIKYYREQTGSDLRESKDNVDAMWEGTYITKAR